jgi:TolB-like protein
MAVLMFLGLAAAMAWTLYTKPMRTPPHQNKLVILVTPFENLSGDPAQEFLSDVLTDEMITRLGQISPSKVSVMARSTAMQYKHTHKSVEQMARECRLDYVLEGSVRRQENRIRVTVQLFRAGERGSLWTEAYEQDASNLLMIQQDVAERIAHSLSLEVLPVSAGPTPVNQGLQGELTEHTVN